MRPTEYLARNVRVGPFYFEDVKSYFERYPDLSTVYCFSTDYPHREGGRDAKNRFLSNLNGVDPSLLQQFFVDNGRWLLPA
jgi:hypothetical protein